MTDTPPEAEPQPEPPIAASDEDATQEAINKAAGDARKKGRASGRKDILESLGFEDAEQAKAAFADYQARVDAEKSEVELAREQAETARHERDEAQTQLARSDLRANVSQALLDAGVPPTRLTAALRHVDLDAITDADTLTIELEAVKTDLPELFAQLEPGAPAPPAFAVAGGTRDITKPSAGKTGIKAGRSRYADEKPGSGN